MLQSRERPRRVCWTFADKRRFRLVLMFVSACALAISLICLNYKRGSSRSDAIYYTSIPSEAHITQIDSDMNAYRGGRISRHEYTNSELTQEFPLDFDGGDVLVFLHMQKTGGTLFGHHLVRNLQLAQPFKCTRGRHKHYRCCNSKQQIWLFSRYSTGWVCGLHADWTELKACADHELDKLEATHRYRR